MSKVRVFCIVGGIIPSSVLDILNPYGLLRDRNQIDFKYKCSREVSRADFVDIDVVVFHRLCEPADVRWLSICSDLGIPYIYQSDDNFFDIPTDTEIGRYHRSPERILTVIQFIQNAALVRVYSDVFADRVRQFNSRVKVCTTCFDVGLLEGLHRRDPDKNKVRIVYATSRGAGDSIQAIMIPALEEIAAKYSNEVEIYFWGAPPESLVLKAASNVKQVSYTKNYEEYLEKFQFFNFDIGLAPLLDDVFFNSKTNNKYREMGGGGVAGIYSRVPLYTSCVESEINGLLVDNSKESWFAAIEKLIHDSELREKIIKNSYEDVKLNYSVDKFTSQILTDLEGVVVSGNNPTVSLSFGGDVAIALDPEFLSSDSGDLFWRRFKQMSNSMGIRLHISKKAPIILSDSRLFIEAASVGAGVIYLSSEAGTSCVFEEAGYTSFKLKLADMSFYSPHTENIYFAVLRVLTDSKILELSSGLIPNYKKKVLYIYLKEFFVIYGQAYRSYKAWFIQGAKRILRIFG